MGQDAAGQQGRRPDRHGPDRQGQPQPSEALRACSASPPADLLHAERDGQPEGIGPGHDGPPDRVPAGGLTSQGFCGTFRRMSSQANLAVTMQA
jgi:hypothetical protein